MLHKEDLIKVYIEKSIQAIKSAKSKEDLKKLLTKTEFFVDEVKKVL